MWPTHYAMHSFFIEKINNMSTNIENYLEIGCGHGLFLAEAIKKFGRKTKLRTDAKIGLVINSINYKFFN